MQPIYIDQYEAQVFIILMKEMLLILHVVTFFSYHNS